MARGAEKAERISIMLRYSVNTDFNGIVIFDPDRLIQSTRAATALLMSACYLQDPPSRAGELATELFSQLPGVKPGVAESMAKVFLENLTVPELRWEQNYRLSWINNWIYSQRNPKSTMSVLNQEDFDFIEKFFDRQ